MKLASTCLSPTELAAPFTVTVQASDWSLDNSGELKSQASLWKSHLFSRTYLVRLVHVKGLETEEAFVQVSFAEPQPFNDGSRRSLGLSSAPLSREFVRVAGNYLPSTFQIQLLKSSGEPFSKVPEKLVLTLILQFTPYNGYPSG